MELVKTSEIIQSCGFAFIYLLIRKLNDISIATETLSLNTSFMPAVTHSRVYKNGSLKSELGKVGKCSLINMHTGVLLDLQ